MANDVDFDLFQAGGFGDAFDDVNDNTVTCSSCGKQLPNRDFSKLQLERHESVRRCKVCTGQESEKKNEKDQEQQSAAQPAVQAAATTQADFDLFDFFGNTDMDAKPAPSAVEAAETASAVVPSNAADFDPFDLFGQASGPFAAMPTAGAGVPNRADELKEKTKKEDKSRSSKKPQREKDGKEAKAPKAKQEGKDAGAVHTGVGSSWVPAPDDADVPSSKESAASPNQSKKAKGRKGKKDTEGGDETRELKEKKSEAAHAQDEANRAVRGLQAAAREGKAKAGGAPTDSWVHGDGASSKAGSKQPSGAERGPAGESKRAAGAAEESARGACACDGGTVDLSTSTMMTEAEAVQSARHKQQVQHAAPHYATASGARATNVSRAETASKAYAAGTHTPAAAPQPNGGAYQPMNHQAYQRPNQPRVASAWPGGPHATPYGQVPSSFGLPAYAPVHSSGNQPVAVPFGAQPSAEALRSISREIDLARPLRAGARSPTHVVSAVPVPSAVREAFAWYDRGTGSLDTTELHCALKLLGLRIDSHAALELLQRHDCERDRLIDVVEFNSLVNDLRCAKAQASAGDAGPAQPQAHSNPHPQPHPHSHLHAQPEPQHFSSPHHSHPASTTPPSTGASVSQPVLWAFEAFDKDRNGYIDRAEMLCALRQLGLKTDSAAAETLLHAREAAGARLFDIHSFNALAKELSCLKAAAVPGRTAAVHNGASQDGSLIDQTRCPAPMAGSPQRALHRQWGARASSPVPAPTRDTLVHATGATLASTAHAQRAHLDAMERAAARARHEAARVTPTSLARSGHAERMRVQVAALAAAQSSFEQTQRAREHEEDVAAVAQLPVSPPTAQPTAQPTPQFELTEQTQARQQMVVNTAQQPPHSQPPLIASPKWQNANDISSSTRSYSMKDKLGTRLERRPRIAFDAVAGPSAPPSCGGVHAAQAVSVPKVVADAFIAMDGEGSGRIDAYALHGALMQLGLRADSPTASEVLSAHNADGTQPLDVHAFNAVVKDLLALSAPAKDSPLAAAVRSALVKAQAAATSVQSTNAARADATHSSLRGAVPSASTSATAATSKRSGHSAALRRSAIAANAPPAVRAAFQTFDSDVDGQVDSYELHRALLRLQLHVESPAAKALLRRAGAERTRKFNFVEFAEIAAELEQIAAEMRVTSGSEMASPSLHDTSNFQNQRARPGICYSNAPSLDHPGFAEHEGYLHPHATHSSNSPPTSYPAHWPHSPLPSASSPQQPISRVNLPFRAIGGGASARPASDETRSDDFDEAQARAQLSSVAQRISSALNACSSMLLNEASQANTHVAASEHVPTERARKLLECTYFS